MIILILLLYGVPVYLIFFQYKLVPLTTFWKVFLWIPPVVALLFLWFALGRYTPTVQTAYVQAPVVQITPEVGGLVTELAVKDNDEVKRGTPLFQIDRREYQYRVDQANARLIEVRESALSLLASLYAAEESVSEANANLLVTKQNEAAVVNDLEAAKKAANEAKQQLDLAEISANRSAQLVGSSTVTKQEYENRLRDVATQRAAWIGAQNNVSRAETAQEVTFLQVNMAEAGFREARAVRGKTEVLVDPVKTLRRIIDFRQADLERLKKEQPRPSDGKQDTASELQKVTAELDRLQEYLKRASAIDPMQQEFPPSVRQAIEALNDAILALERTTVASPVDGIVTNFQLTLGAFAKPGTPVASVIDTTQWRLIAAVPENWLEKIRPGDDVYFSLRNYPGRVRTAKVEYIGRGVLQGQGIPSGNLPDTDPRQTRQPDTPQAGQEFQVRLLLRDDQPNRPLRVGMTGRVTVFAGGGFPIVNQLAPILHTVFSWLDFLHPKPSSQSVLIAIAAVIGIVIYLRQR